MCVGRPKAAEHLLLAALFFVSFFWANKRKKIELRKGGGSNRKLKVHPHSKNLYDQNTSPASGDNAQKINEFTKMEPVRCKIN